MMPSEASKIVTMLITAYPDAWRFLSEEQQEATRQLWREMLADLAYSVADAALRRLIGTRSKMPAIADFRATCSAYTEGRREHGGEAWGAVLKLIGRYGMNRTPRLFTQCEIPGNGDEFPVTDPVLLRVIDAMGWRELCLSENQAADRARVIELYEQLSREDAAERSVRAIAPPIPERRSGGVAVALGGIVSAMLPSGSKP